MEMPAGYDLWRTDSGYHERDSDGDEPWMADAYLDDMSKFEAAMSRDEVAPGFHQYGPYVVRVFENGDCDFVGTLVLPSRVGWEPVF